MEKLNYHLEPYWSDVAKRIGSRKGKNVIAGDDEPYYRYKRKKFLEMLQSVDFTGKKVLEVGCGPGGNLKEIIPQNPKELYGVDISQEMIHLAKEVLADNKNVHLEKIDGQKLPFDNESFDTVFTATVLQHNTNEIMLKNLLSEVCRVTKKELVLFERIDSGIKGDELCLGRPVSYYEALCKENSFKLKEVQYINIHTSYLFSGAIRKLLNPSTRKEGEPLNSISVFLQNLSLPVTRILDRILPVKRDIAKMVFIRRY